MSIETPLSTEERILAELLFAYKDSFIDDGRVVSYPDRARRLGSVVIEILKPFFDGSLHITPTAETQSLLDRRAHALKLNRIVELKKELTRIQDEIEAAKKAEADAKSQLNNPTEGTNNGN